MFLISVQIFLLNGKKYIFKSENLLKLWVM